MSLKKRKFYTSNIQVNERAWDEKTEDYTGIKLFDIYFANEVDEAVVEYSRLIRLELFKGKLTNLKLREIRKKVFEK